MQLPFLISGIQFSNRINKDKKKKREKQGQKIMLILNICCGKREELTTIEAFYFIPFKYLHSNIYVCISRDFVYAVAIIVGHKASKWSVGPSKWLNIFRFKQILLRLVFNKVNSMI